MLSSNKDLNPNQSPCPAHQFCCCCLSCWSLWKNCRTVSIFQTRTYIHLAASLSCYWWNGSHTHRRMAERLPSQVGRDCHLFSSGSGWKGWNGWTHRNLGPLLKRSPVVSGHLHSCSTSGLFSANCQGSAVGTSLVCRHRRSPLKMAGAPGRKMTQVSSLTLERWAQL